MKILLLGEYSGVHTNLASAFRKKGYSVTTVHNGDSYKSFKPDIFLSYKEIESNNLIVKKLLELYYLILVYSGFKGLLQIFKFLPIIKDMKEYDVVQLINPRFLAGFGSIVNFLVFLYIRKFNKKIFLCALGDDYFWVKYCLDKKYKYSMFDRLSLKNLRNYAYSLQYVYGFLNPLLNRYVARKSNVIIAGLLDYFIPYKQIKNISPVVLIPIIVDVTEVQPLNFENIKYPINIFHGWQPGKELSKGNDIFHKAITRLKDKYPDKINYTVLGGVSFEEYNKTFTDAHIFIDQCYSQDCGVNALLGLAKGKVVLSGFEDIVKNYYNIDYNPLINAIPDEDYIFSELEKIIIQPTLLTDYSTNAIEFMKSYHSAEYVLKLYEDIWE